jgi:hypothetical protein
MPKKIPLINSSAAPAIKAISGNTYKSFSMGNAPKSVDEKSLGRPFNSTGMRFPPYSSQMQHGALQHA